MDGGRCCGGPSIWMLLSLLLQLLHATGGAESGCPDNRCCRTDVAEYIRLCRAVREYCIPHEQPAGPCACDVDGDVPAQDTRNESGPKILVHTGRPGCARHTTTWQASRDQFCYVPYECNEGERTFSWPNIKWRKCSSNNPRCPSGCQAALDDILSAGTIKDCITDQASRQGLCAALDVLESAASIGENPVMDGVHYSSMEYLRHWAKANGCRVEGQLDSNGLDVDGVFWSLRNMIKVILFVCCCPCVFAAALRVTKAHVCLLDTLEDCMDALMGLRRGSHPGRSKQQYELVSSADLDDVEAD